MWLRPKTPSDVEATRHWRPVDAVGPRAVDDLHMGMVDSTRHRRPLESGPPVAAGLRTGTEDWTVRWRRAAAGPRAAYGLRTDMVGSMESARAAREEIVLGTAARLETQYALGKAWNRDRPLVGPEAL